MSWTMDLQPVGRRIPLEPGESLLDAVRRVVTTEGDGIYAPCGGLGTCGRCRVRVLRGPASPPTETERDRLTAAELEGGLRLACQVRPLGPLHVELPPETLAGHQSLQVEGESVAVPLDPAVRAYRVPLRPTSLAHPGSVWEQVREHLASFHGLRDIHVDLDLVCGPSARAEETTVQVAVRAGRITDARFNGSALRPLGLAVDLGTTKVAGFLVDLESGSVLASDGLMNPQIPYGEDLMSRLAHALGGEEGVDRLARAAGEGIDRLLGNLVKKAGLERAEVQEIVIAGNTAMHHLLLSLPIEQLARAPYVPALAGPIEVPSARIGVSAAPRARVYLVPPVAGFVGGDHVAMILGARIQEAPETVLGLDIGTNTEIVLARGGHLTSCSCASGPAFEGAHVHQGMRAVDGAISRMRLADGGRSVACETIGGGPPRGFCGSGILDSVAELVRHRVVDERGMLDRSHPRVRKEEGSVAQFLVVPAAETDVGHDLVVTQRDVNEIQLAKGAVASGVELLLRAAELKADAIDRVVVAGAFGTHLDLESAVRVGLLPDLPRERFQQVGNAAGTGARMALVSLAERRTAERLAERIDYLELTTRPDFSGVFARALRFTASGRG
ncbi:MAG: DUF4445 domain-containing protein [Deltaproteobacteria bacterium]|nr:DUF4445 domain-containing protein [Deltaproteobacteria bacterium]